MSANNRKAVPCEPLSSFRLINITFPFDSKNCPLLQNNSAQWLKRYLIKPVFKQTDRFYCSDCKCGVALLQIRKSNS